MTGHWCPGDCSTRIPASALLCVSCTLTLTRYWDENPDLVKRIAGTIPVDAALSLAHHAEFDLYLVAHGIDP